MRVAIIDDEELARSIIREHLEPHKDIQIVAECSNGFDAVKDVAEMKPDLLFLDIQMPKLNGFEVLELLDPKPAVVFVTAHDDYAINAFDVRAVNYLLKPFSQTRFEETLKRVRERVGSDEANMTDLIQDARVRTAPLERVLVRNGPKVEIIPVAAIDYIEAQDDYVCIHTAGKKHLKQERLSGLDAALDQRHFVRIHRSYILNIDRMARLEAYAKDSRIAILKDGAKLPVSRTGYDKLRKLL